MESGARGVASARVAIVAGDGAIRPAIAGYDMPDGLWFRRDEFLAHFGGADQGELLRFATVAISATGDWPRLVREVAVMISANNFVGSPTVVLIEATESATAVFVHGSITIELPIASGLVCVDGSGASTWIEQIYGPLIGSASIKYAPARLAASLLPLPVGPPDESSPPQPANDSDPTVAFKGGVPAIEVGPAVDEPAPGHDVDDADDAPTISRGDWDSSGSDRTISRDPGRATSRSDIVVGSRSGLSDPVAPGQVRGLACSSGHPNRPTDAECRTCGVVLTEDLGAVVGPRPPLGWLLIDDGTSIELTQPCLIGRRPPDDHTLGGEPALAVHLDDSAQHISQRHLEIHLVGWDVRAIDCGSTNGTKHRRAGSRRAGPMKPHDQLTLEPGDVLELGERTITFVTGRP
jgi:hypothetical protein